MNAASRAAVEVAQQLGFRIDQPVLIQETNNTVLWLQPHAIIAKVATRSDSTDGVIREHQIVSKLHELGALVAPPIPDISPQRHNGTGFTVTLWQRLDGDFQSPAPGHIVGGSLRGLHEALGVCEVPLPSFRVGLQRARRALNDDRLVDAMAHRDRAFLRSAYDALLAELEEHTATERALHGKPHDANYVLTSSGLRWIDFESASHGRLEWDLAFLPRMPAPPLRTSTATCSSFSER